MAKNFPGVAVWQDGQHEYEAAFTMFLRSAMLAGLLSFDRVTVGVLRKMRGQSRGHDFATSL